MPRLKTTAERTRAKTRNKRDAFSCDCDAEFGLKELSELIKGCARLLHHPTLLSPTETAVLISAAFDFYRTLQSWAFVAVRSFIRSLSCCWWMDLLPERGLFTEGSFPLSSFVCRCCLSILFMSFRHCWKTEAAFVRKKKKSENTDLKHNLNRVFTDLTAPWGECVGDYRGPWVWGVLVTWGNVYTV